jgi:signal transduction histidine kinase
MAPLSHPAPDPLHFLSEASALLADSLDDEATLARVAQLAVPAIADWCAVYISDEDGTIRPLAAAHADAERQEAWDRHLESRYPVDLSPRRGVPSVPREGRSEIYPEVSDAQLMAIAQDAEHLALLRDSSVRSVMVVPLQARKRTLGAVMFGIAGSGRRFHERDLALAEELARRAAIAIDHARLYQETQAAKRRAEEEQTRLRQEATPASGAVEANGLIADLLAAISHELRTPLAAIKGYTSVIDLFLDKMTLEEQREFLSEINGAADRLTEMVNDWLQLARIESGLLVMERGPVALFAVLETAVAEARRRYPGRGITLKVESALPLIRGDARRINQVAANLLDNAVKYSTDDATVDVRAWQLSEGMVAFSVTDSGIGIAPADRGRVFDRSFRAENPATRDITGTGLGLTICRSLVEAWGGSIVLASVEGRGSSFTVTLPVTAPPTR